MEVPRWTDDAPSEFLSYLREAGGFNQWVTFSRRQDFYAALGLGILLHFYPTYTEAEKYMRVTWKPMLEALKVHDNAFVETHGERRYELQEYWEGLNSQCRNLCADMFASSDPIKSIAAAKIRSGQILDFSDVDNYRKLAMRLKLCIGVYQLVEKTLQVAEFHSDSGGGEIAFIVCIAIEKGRPSLLVHKNFQWQTVVEAAFPNYIKLSRASPQLPQISQLQKFASIPVTPISSSDDNPVIISILATMVGYLAKEVEVSTRDLDQSLRPVHESLATVWKELKKLLEKHPELTCEVDTQELRTVLSLPFRPQPTCPRQPHTVVTCAQYPELGQTLEVHTHTIHKECLRSHLELDLKKHHLELNCPICSYPLPEKTLDEFPDLQRTFNDTKTHALANSKQGEVYKCANCSIPVSQSFSLAFEHGCRLCMPCVDRCRSSNVCSRCGTAFSASDFHQVEASSYRQSFYFPS